jgi:hypothetical protein
VFFLATRKNKPIPSGTGIALGTSEANEVRQVTSQREVLQTLGVPAFVTSAGAQVHGHECSEYGLHALWSFMGTSSLAYYVRGDIDLGGLMPTSTEPTRDPVDGTYWIDTSTAAQGGFYRRNSTNTGWDAVHATVFTAAPTNGDGSAGDIALDFSNKAAPVVKIKNDAGTWVQAGSGLNVLIATKTATTATMWVQDTAPTGAGANDYWWKTNKDAGGYNLKLKRYRAVDDTWVDVVPARATIQPTDVSTSSVWEDLSSFATNGQHPLKVGTGSGFAALTYTIGASAPTQAAQDGDLWFSDDITDFAMYKSDATTVKWNEITTVTTASPTNVQKVISTAAPATPATGALWIDVSGGNLDNFPVVKRWNSTSWEDITASVLVGTYVAPNLIPNGTYWINLDDLRTKCTVKQYDSTYQPVNIDPISKVAATYDATTMKHWKPIAGARFGRKAQRYVVVSALQKAAAATDNLRAPHINYQLILAPGYPELFDDMETLNDDIGNRAHVIADTPFTMVPSGVAQGREITVTDWKNNVRAAAETGEVGFQSAGVPYASMYYPHGMSTNVDGSTVFVPASTMMVRTIVKSDIDTAVSHAPMGLQNGTITNATALGYLTYDGKFKSLSLTQGQATILYDNHINPIQNLYKIGLRNMGNRSTYGADTLLSSTNVARLVSEMMYDLNRSFLPFLGMPHHPETWAAVRNTATRYMNGKIAQNAISDALVICDENNNDDAAIANKELYVDIAFVPVTAVEFIYVRLRVDNPGDL